MRDIRGCLKSEGLRDDQITWDADYKFEDETGFFSYRMEHGFPYMTHFFVDADKRNAGNAIKLYQKFKNIIMGQGYDHFIAEVIPGKEVFGKFFKACLNCPEPYAIVNGNKYYFVKMEVGV